MYKCFLKHGIDLPLSFVFCFPFKLTYKHEIRYGIIRWAQANDCNICKLD